MGTRQPGRTPGEHPPNQQTSERRARFEGFVTQNEKVVEVLDLLARVADSDATVVITGESGTGKELLAVALHRQSSRRNKPFVAVNCGAVVETLQESQFFGHVAGAFTGANHPKIGWFEAADGGSILLDEINEMHQSLQVKLLRILQSGEYAPVGMATNKTCDVRVICATSQNLEDLVASKRFRKDLFYRLNIVAVKLPPLRQRRGDIPLLIDHFLSLLSKRYEKRVRGLDSRATALLIAYDFPGNVRELENIMKRAVLLCAGDWIKVVDLPPQIITSSETKTERPRMFREAKAAAIEKFERTFLSSTLSDCGGIVSRAARRAGLSERNFHAKLRSYGISGKSFRADSCS